MLSESKTFFVTLSGRSLIRIGGPDRIAFLQGLVSNDMALLEKQPCVYACLLSAQGKFLHDFFISTKGEILLLECEGGARAEDLLSRLKTYKLRSKIDLTCETNVPVYAAFGDAHAAAYPDPRHPDMGFRTFTKPENMPEEPSAFWDERRLRLGIPDGSRDFEVGQSTLEEGHLDRFHGISFTKGCYVGQELTARMHHRGLGKKHLYPIEAPPGHPLPATGADIVVGGEAVGVMRSSCGPVGLALLKDGAACELIKGHSQNVFSVLA